MKKVLLNWRYYILTIVSGICILGVFADPEYNDWRWFVSFFITKAVGVLFGYIFYKLMNYWESRNEIQELTELCKEEDDVWE